MKRAWMILPWVFAWVAIAACAGQAQAAAPAPGAKKPPAEKPSAEAAALKHESAIPKRELVFEQSEEEVPMAILVGPGLDIAELAKQRYVVTLRLRFTTCVVAGYESPGSRRSPRGKTAQDAPKPLELKNLVASGQFRPHAYGRAPEDLSLHRGWMFGFPELAKLVPRDRLPAQELVDILVGGSQMHVRGRAVRGVTTGWPPESENKVREETETLQLELLAPTPERARQLAHAALVLYDYGHSLPAHQSYVELQQYWESVASDLRRGAKGAEDELAGYQKQLDELKAWSDMGDREAKPNLAVQQRLIAVEEAGIAARIEACEKILKEGKGLTPARIDQVETIKTTAEIELVGLAAKRKAIEQIIEKARQYSTLSSKAATAKYYRDAYRSHLPSAEVPAAVYGKAVREKTAFAAVEGKIPIRRVRWEQPKPPESKK